MYIAGKLIKEESLPKEEENFQKVYVKAPSFLSIHMGVKAEVLPLDTDCHHFVLEVVGSFLNLESLIALGFVCYGLLDNAATKRPLNGNNRLSSICTYLGQLDEIGRTLRKYLFEYTNYTRFFISSWRSSHPSYIHNFFHGRLEGRPRLKRNYVFPLAFRFVLLLLHVNQSRNIKLPCFLFQGLSRIEYEAKKQVVTDEIISRLEKKLFPGLKSSIEFIEVKLKPDLILVALCFFFFLSSWTF